MLMFILLAVLLVMVGFAFLRHWKIRKHHKTIANPWRQNRRRQ